MKKKNYKAPDERVVEISYGKHFCLSATGTHESFEQDSYDDTWGN